jgi:hypothetical protein
MTLRQAQLALKRARQVARFLNNNGFDRADEAYSIVQTLEETVQQLKQKDK